MNTTTIHTQTQNRTVAVECCYQNVGIATSLALTMFDGDDLNDAMGVPFFYGVTEMVFVGAYCFGAWKAGWTKAPANAPFWKVLVTSYEVLVAEGKDLSEIEISYRESDDIPADEKSEDGRVLTHYYNASQNSLGTGLQAEDNASEKRGELA